MIDKHGMNLWLWAHWHDWTFDNKFKLLIPKFSQWILLSYSYSCCSVFFVCSCFLIGIYPLILTANQMSLHFSTILHSILPHREDCSTFNCSTSGRLEDDQRTNLHVSSFLAERCYAKQISVLCFFFLFVTFSFVCFS